MLPPHSFVILDSVNSVRTQAGSLTLKNRTKERNQTQMQTYIIVIKYETKNNWPEQP